jgi:hypothetical protein
MDILDQRAKRFEKALTDSTDDVAALVVTWLHLQPTLLFLVRIAAPNGEVLDDQDYTDLSLLALVQFAVAMKVLPEDLRPIFKKLNKYRNDVAHKIDFQLTEAQRKEFFELVPLRVRSNAMLVPADGDYLKKGLRILEREVQASVGRWMEQNVDRVKELLKGS